MSSSQAAISVRGLSKSYRISHNATQTRSLAEAVTRGIKSRFRRADFETFWALRDVNFDIPQGEVVGIIGRNGAGKSTLLKVLSRITEPTTGEIDLFGRVGSLLEVGTGFHPELTGRENIYLNGGILGMSRREINRQFDAIVEFAEVERFLDTPVKRYSSGMYVRLAFAVAAHLEPEILVVDEVLAVGDTSFQKKCMGKMQDVAKTGRTVLFVSHNMAAVENLCTSGLLMQRGQVVQQGPVKSIIQGYLEQSQSDTGTNFLDEHAYRSGNGEVKFTHFYVTDRAGRKLDTVQCGQDIVLVFGYKSANGQEPRSVRVGFGLHPQTGERLAVFYTNYKGQDYTVAPAVGEFKCLLPRFPFTPGRYSVYPRIEVGGTEADWPRDGVGFFDVEAGDFFGTGRMIGGDGAAPFLIDGDWSLAKID